MNQIQLQPNKTYATKANVVKAVAKSVRCSNLRYFITQTDDNRFFPVFVGQAAIEQQAFFEFPVIA